jgi:type II secretory pathway component PulK
MVRYLLLRRPGAALFAVLLLLALVVTLLGALLR